jgi:hypothetical protein
MLIDSAEAQITIRWHILVVGAMGEKAAWLRLIILLLHTAHVHIHEVLHGVLNPKAHIK